ncbi:MAG: adenine deaminase [Pseudomonadota bacterium]
MSLEKRIAAAAGEIPADLVIKNANIVSVTSGRIIHGDIGIIDGVILGVGKYKSRKTIDVRGAYVSSGFFDAHMHLESTMISPVEFAKTVVPLGTTSVIVDPHEIANVLGVKGIRYMLNITEGLPLDVYFMIPSCVPSTNLETSGAKITADDLAQFWKHPRVLGLAEVMNYPGVIHRNRELMRKIKKAKGHTIDGHAPGLTKIELNAYLMANIRSDHESTTAKEAAAKLAAGLHLMVREGTCERNLKDLLPVVNKSNAHRCMFCTDDRVPKDLINEGHINYVIKKAIRFGLSPLTAIQMATLNTAEYFRFEEKQGAIAVGHKADLVVFDNFHNFKIKMVFKNGKIVAKDGKMVVEIKPKIRTHFRRNVNIGELADKSFKIKAESKNIRVIELVPHQIVTKEIVQPARIVDGYAEVNSKMDLAKLAVIERHHATGNVGLGFVKGFGLKRGALASTVAHDSHNLIVVGMNDGDMLEAARALEEANGGFAAVMNGKVLEVLPLPIAGLMTDMPIKDVMEYKKRLLKAASKLGSRLEDPFQTLSFLALAVIPEIKLTDRGLVDVVRQKFVDLFIA